MHELARAVCAVDPHCHQATMKEVISKFACTYTPIWLASIQSVRHGHAIACKGFSLQAAMQRGSD